MIRKQFAVIAARIKEELANITRLQEELKARGIINIDKKINIKKLDHNDSFALRAVGSILHDFYVSVENVCKLIAREIDEQLPLGENWHKELLKQMMLEIPGVRPALLTRETASRLEEFRAFRHVFRNVYGFNLSAERLRDLLKKFPDTAQRFEREVLNFIKDLEQVLP